MSQRSRQIRERRQRQRTLGRRTAGVGALLALIAGALLLFGTRLDSGDDPGGNDSANVRVSMTEFAFEPDPIVLSRSDARLEVVNDGKVAHDLLVIGLGKGTPDLAPGARMVLDLSDQPAGRYRVVCDLPGHTEAGMVTELVLQ